MAMSERRLRKQLAHIMSGVMEMGQTATKKSDYTLYISPTKDRFLIDCGLYMFFVFALSSSQHNVSLLKQSMSVL
jgi:hypothetical protein